MNSSTILEHAETFVREHLAGDSSGHDWWHIDRVRRAALEIARGEGADLFVVELAALLHDVSDWKFTGGDSSRGPNEVREWLQQQAVEPATIDRVCQIISEVTFKGAGVATPTTSLEGQAVQDADRLDAIGAVGIARAFAYGGSKGRAMVDPDISLEMHDSFAAYKKNSGPTINHFYEKLLLLKDRMNTASGKRLADERHRFMEQFLAQFHAECAGQR